MTTNKVLSNTQAQSTYSNIALLSIWTVGVLGGLLMPVPEYKISSQRAVKYYSAVSDASYDSHSDLFKESFSAINLELDELIGLFYQKMIDSQEELGRDFSSIYFKNAWNLYEH